MATHVAILPSDALDLPISVSSGSKPANRFLRLPHPRTGLASLFLPYEPRAGDGSKRNAMLEVQAVAPTNARSWFIGQQVVADGKLLVMTPIDPAFLLIPILQSVYPENGAQGMFRPADEIFEDAAANLERSSESSSAAGKDNSLIVSKEDVLQFTSLECCQSALHRVCDVKEITEDITVFRFSPEKVVEYLRVKVQRLSTQETVEVSRTLIRSLAKDGLMEDGKENMLEVGRIRAACDLVAQYTPPGIRKLLSASFTPLDAHYKAIEDENAALSVEKAVKPKPAPTNVDKKRKPGTGASQGVEKLKKAKIGGMAKLSTFFAKKVPT